MRERKRLLRREQDHEAGEQGGEEGQAGAAAARAKAGAAGGGGRRGRGPGGRKAEGAESDSEEESGGDSDGEDAEGEGDGDSGDSDDEDDDQDAEEAEESAEDEEEEEEASTATGGSGGRGAAQTRPAGTQGQGQRLALLQQPAQQPPVARTREEALIPEVAPALPLAPATRNLLDRLNIESMQVGGVACAWCVATVAARGLALAQLVHKGRQQGPGQVRRTLSASPYTLTCTGMPHKLSCRITFCTSLVHTLRD